MFEIHLNDNTLVATEYLALRMSIWTKFMHPNDAIVRNILLFGFVGSGKTSYLNSLFTAKSSSNTEICNMGVAGGDSTHVTTDYTGRKLLDLNCYEMKDDEEKKSAVTNFQIFDPWGLDKIGYVNSEFENMLKGRIKNKTSKNDAKDGVVS
jgi:GTPase SAR1 family protein